NELMQGYYFPFFRPNLSLILIRLYKSLILFRSNIEQIVQSRDFKNIIHYQNVEKAEPGVQDEHENNYGCGGYHAWVVNNILVSCWTILPDGQFTDEAWKIFPNRPVAIVSTVEEIEKFLKETIIQLLSEGWSLEHGEVKYYDRKGKDAQKPLEMGTKMRIPFLKPQKFSNQQEYRFSLFGPVVPQLENLTFFAKPFGDRKPVDYIDGIYFRTPEDKNRFLVNCCDAGLGSRAQ
ncbi:hypothetical protein WDW89_14990, partial [Deltaproteobacteria bacterium TL4]